MKQESHNQSPSQASRFILNFALILTLTMTAIILFNIWGNVWGNYGDTGFFLFYNDRKAKSEHLLKVPQHELAQIWIIGSSNMMPFQPSTFEQTFKKKTFNLGTYWGRIEDFWCWTQFLTEDVGTKPEMIVLGVETWSFGHENAGPMLYPHLRRRLLNAPLLVSKLDEYNATKHFVSKAADAISSQQIKFTIAEAIRRNAKRHSHLPLSQSGTFRNDGTQLSYNHDPPAHMYLSQEVNAFYAGLASGKQTQHEIEVQNERKRLMNLGLIHTSEVQGYFPGETFHSESIQLFERFLQRCEELNIRVAIIMLPTHPYFDDLLRSQTKHTQNLHHMKTLLLAMKQKYPMLSAVVDASHISYFNGDPYGFHDKFHMTPSNCDKVIDLLSNELREQE